jgi:hypothetical protein
MTTTGKDNTRSRIEFALLGIGEALNRGRYIVPVNQREYAWDEVQVRSLISDFSNAMGQGKSAYFLGTIVLTRGEEDVPEIADGQQRLATATIFLAAIRDWFYLNNEMEHAQSIETDFLRKFDRDSRDHISRLTLNVQDNEFFRRRILSRPDTAERNIQPEGWSHKRIEAAAQLYAKHIGNNLKNLSKDHQIAYLNNWWDFIEKTAQVIVLTVPDELDAFVMFETLNARALPTSQADLIKNYLFKQATRGRLSEAQQKWTIMIGALETLEEEDITVSYLRSVLSSLYGVTRRREVFARVKQHVAGRAQAISFLDILAEYANEYVAILNADSPKWNTYGSNIGHSIRAIRTLGVSQIHPLMLAVARHFSPKEAEKAFRLFVGWSVRFLIAGGGGAGTTEELYAEAAKEVTQGNLTTAKQLASHMLPSVPTDAEFQVAFTGATVSKASLARYYLRALELKLQGEPEPEWVPNEDKVINLEHVLPAAPGKKWPGVSPDLAAVIYRRLGNMVLLQASKNTALGNKKFAEKRDVLKDSPYLLTKMVGEKASWKLQDINERQKKLAKLAVETWPATI